MQNFIEKPTSKLKKKGMTKTKGTWIEEQCQGIEETLQKKKQQQQESRQLVKELTSSKQGRTTTVQKKSREMSHRRTRHSKEVDRVLF